MPTNRPAANSTNTQKATCAAISACITRRDACGSAPPLSASTGFTAEARSAGARPNRQVDHQRQREPERGDAPVERHEQRRGIVRRIDQADDERRGPPREQRAEQRGAHREPHAFAQHELHEPRAARANRDAQRHLAARATRPGRSSGWRRWRGRSAARSRRARRARSARDGCCAAAAETPAPAGSSVNLSLMNRSRRCFEKPTKPPARFSWNARKTHLEAIARRFRPAPRRQASGAPRCGTSSISSRVTVHRPSSSSARISISVTVPVSVPVNLFAGDADDFVDEAVH